MQRVVAGIVVSGLLLLAPALAGATVTYTWEPLTPGTNQEGQPFLIGSGTLVATGPLVYGVSVPLYDPAVNYGSPFLELELHAAGWPFSLGPNLSGNMGYVIVEMAMSPAGAGIGSGLTGSLYANNGESDFSMTSTDGVWSVVSAHSDVPDACMVAPWCSGGTGRWVLTAIPEPGHLGLAFLGFGAIALMLIAKRKPGASV